MGAAEKALELDWGQILLGIVVIITLSKVFIEAFDLIFKVVKNKVLGDKANDDLKDTLKKLDERLNYVENGCCKIDSLIESIAELSKITESINEKCIANNDATIETLHRTISEKCKVYIEEYDGIPSDEYDWFFRLADCYTKCGGNHGLQDKVKYCKENLKIITR